MAGSSTHLVGYTSTSRHFDCAFKFATQELKEERIAVIFKIKFKGDKGLFLLTREYSAYPEEEEVLV